jgi:hypothetical protein
LPILTEREMMIFRSVRCRAAASVLAVAVFAVAACGSAGPGSKAAAYPAIDGAQLKTALLGISDLPAGFVRSTTDSGNVNPGVTAAPSDPVSPAGGKGSSPDKNPACKQVRAMLARLEASRGGDGSNAYAYTSFGNANSGNAVHERLEAYPANNVPLLRSRLKLSSESMARCSLYTSPHATISAAKLALPPLGDGSAWFQVSDTIDGLPFKAAIGTVDVGNVVISLMVFGGSHTPSPTLTMGGLARTAVSKVMLLRRHITQP